MELADAKSYLRVDSDVDDVLIADLMAVAEDYIRDAVTDYDAKAAELPAFVRKSEMCQKVVLADLYESRNLTAEGRDFGYTVRSLLTQLQNTPTPETVV